MKEVETHRNYLAVREQAGKFGGGNDRHSAVVRGLEILISGHEVLGRGCGRHEIEKRSILRITQRSVGWMRIDELYLGVEGGQKGCDINAGPSKRSLEFWSPQDCFQFRKGLRAHDGDETTL